MGWLFFIIYVMSITNKSTINSSFLTPIMYCMKKVYHLQKTAIIQ